MVDLIAKKRQGGKLEKDELAFFVRGYSHGEIPDYQAAALCMAICFAGMDAEETANLTMEMAYSGDTIDLSGVPGVKADKHSTGGVGDKTTLIAAPIAASLGVCVAKMSGRGLGHTGGTIDKLESIPGYKTALSRDEFLQIVHNTGISVAGQSANLAPADKKLYALRDVTATVDSIPLIASSVMSKKIAAGADVIVLDVKFGSGAFMKTLGDARLLAEEMVAIGENTGRPTVALITDMNTPLGSNIGNALEIIEVIETLGGHGPADIVSLCVELAASMLSLGGKGNIEACREMAENALRDGSALRKLREMIKAHGGDVSYIDNPEIFPCSNVVHAIKAPRDGWITYMDAGQIGLTAMLLGAGRKDKDSPVDHSAGIVLKRKTGDAVKKGDTVAHLHTNNGSLTDAAQIFEQAVIIGKDKTAQRPLIIERITGGKNDKINGRVR